MRRLPETQRKILNNSSKFFENLSKILSKHKQNPQKLNLPEIPFTCDAAKTAKKQAWIMFNGGVEVLFGDKTKESFLLSNQGIRVPLEDLSVAREGACSAILHSSGTQQKLNLLEIPVTSIIASKTLKKILPYHQL